MGYQAYYREPAVRDNDFDNPAVWLQVNCAGFQRLPARFRAASVRRDWYLLYLTKGRIQILEGAQRAELHAGDGVIFPPGAAFCYRSGGEEAAYYWVHFTGSGAREALQGCRLSPGCRMQPGVLTEGVEGFRRVFSALQGRDGFSDAEAAGALLSLLAALGRAAACGRPRGRLRASLRYLHEHLDRPVSLAELAALEHLSVSRFRVLFAAQTGLPPQEYILREKLARACQLLRETDLPVREVAEWIGYEDPRYFSRLFRGRTGTTPREYRRAADAAFPPENRKG